MTADTVLEVEGISAFVPDGSQRAIYEDISLSVASGESVAIVGRSGSGKSTLLSALGLLSPPSGGSLRVLGQETRELSDATRARLRNDVMGFVFQDYALVRELDVRANVEMPLHYGRSLSRQERLARVTASLALVGMSGAERTRPPKLSGGEQQRVAIARALVSRPRVVLADEPTGALDTRTGDDVISLLKESTSGSGCCLVVVTHDPVVARALDRVVYLDADGLHDAASDMSIRP
jgi:putative ABC transport system ATP-binding protein